MKISFFIYSFITSLTGWGIIKPNAATVPLSKIDTIIDQMRPAAFITNKNVSVKTAHYLQDIPFLLEQDQPAMIELGQTEQNRKIKAWFFPGISEQRALVIGGVHGSELSSIEIAYSLIEKLLTREQRPYYSVIVIPCLFPDNAALAMNYPAKTGGMENIGRYSFSSGVDPNRQMPSPGKAFDEEALCDHLHRTIEKENQLLLQLINVYKPARIANLHAIRNTGYGGIYADPRTDEKGFSLGYASDSSLAIEIASSIQLRGGNVAGNHLAKKPTALYYKDPVPVPKGQSQKRNMNGSSLAGNKGSGISLGTWGTTAITGEQDESKNRNAMRVITIEFPGSKRPVDYSSPLLQSFFQQQITFFADAILSVFLGAYFIEEETSTKYNRI